MRRRPIRYLRDGTDLSRRRVSDTRRGPIRYRGMVLTASGVVVASPLVAF